MHRKKPQTIGWGRPNLMCNVDEKILEVIRKKGVTRQVEKQTPIELRHAQDLI